MAKTEQSARSAGPREQQASQPATASDRLDGDDLVQYLAGRIERRVLSGEYPIGSWLRQERLAEEFGVSRTPVREALRRLEALGLVQQVPRRGVLVRGAVLREIREAYAVRAELEGYAAELAALRKRPRGVDQLRVAEGALRTTTEELVSRYVDDPELARGDSTGWATAADLFHDVVLTMADNDRLRWAVSNLTAAYGRSLTLVLLEDERRDELFDGNICEHAAVREAIERGDGPAARAAMRDHVLSVGRQVLDSIERRSTVQL